MLMISWHLAPKSNGLAFVPWNLREFPQLAAYFNTTDVVVIGRQNGKLCKSDFFVNRCTDEGIYTTDGTFFPYTDANPAYICFETALANHQAVLYNWLIEKADYITADVYHKEGFSKNMTMEVKGLVSGSSLPDVVWKSNQGTVCISLYDRKDGRMKNSTAFRNTTQESQEPVKEDPEKAQSLLAELDGLIGLATVKSEIRTLTNILTLNEKRKERGLTTPKISRHMVFSGSPGTGKTTIARLLSEILGALGILSKGHLIEVDRSGLVAGYLGQTAIKVKEVVNEAIGGVLFIDEAYSLINGEKDEFGEEAVATLLKAMEDNRDDLIVIAAGYTREMENFISSNPGLKSRFSKYIEFPSYAACELVQIYESICTKNGLTISNEILTLLAERLGAIQDDFGNARGVRNLFERTLEAQANRLSQIKEISDKALQEITTEDVKNALTAMGIG